MILSYLIQLLGCKNETFEYANYFANFPKITNKNSLKISTELILYKKNSNNVY